MPQNDFAHKDADGNEYVRERAGDDERLVRKDNGGAWAVVGAVVAGALALFLGSR